MTRVRAFFATHLARLLLLAGLLLLLALVPILSTQATLPGSLTHVATAVPGAPMHTAAVTPEPRTVTFAYDGAGRLQSATYSGRSQSFQYDVSGNLVASAVRTNLYLPAVAKAAQSGRVP